MTDEKLTEEEKKEMFERMSKNPKIREAIKGLLAPLQQDGDSLTISFGSELCSEAKE